MKLIPVFVFLGLYFLYSCNSKTIKKDPDYSGNPVFPGWYADPEGIIIEDEYWI